MDKPKRPRLHVSVKSFAITSREVDGGWIGEVWRGGRLEVATDIKRQRGDALYNARELRDVIRAKELQELKDATSFGLKTIRK